MHLRLVSLVMKLFGSQSRLFNHILEYGKSEDMSKRTEKNVLTRYLGLQVLFPRQLHDSHEEVCTETTNEQLQCDLRSANREIEKPKSVIITATYQRRSRNNSRICRRKYDLNDAKLKRPV